MDQIKNKGSIDLPVVDDCAFNYSGIIPQYTMSSTANPKPIEIKLEKTIPEGSLSEEITQQVLLVRKLLCEIAIKADDDSEMVTDLRGIVKKNPNILFDFAENDQELLSSRALAARFAVVLWGKRVDQQRVETLANHRSPMIRAGVMYGFGDLKDIDRVKVFLNDSHATVRIETQSVLSDLEERDL